jgi:hypothetical protein
MLYVYMSNTGTEKVEDIVENPDQDVFKPVTRLTVPVFKKVMDLGIYDHGDIDREIRNFSLALDSTEEWWD